ncbi:myopalladin isoform X2 [Sphaeramia orbicularis]|uniref:myopalladin isoform X2 n=1 Tax=Sphaeramia orbicularis TaxID=375764 RepID=UPI00117C7616|nr:myopalladin isoform X2 [Sphaeramia orbicularis]
MQDNNLEQPPSLSQLLRESYLAEARAQMSRSDAPPSRLQIYGSLKGKAEDAGGCSDPHFPDLSAFLSQEELDKSVNLARQAIGHEPREERSEVKAPVTPQTPSDSPSPSVPFTNPPPSAFVSPELRELPASQTTFTPDRKMHKAPARQDPVIQTGTGDGFQDLNRSARTAPYGMETQSKKEFLNKAADFIEELSSLFKANSSKRIRPRACKTHRTRAQTKTQTDGTIYALGSEGRERTVLPMEVEEVEQDQRPGPGPAVSLQPQVQPDPGIGTMEFQDCRILEDPHQPQQYDLASQEVEEDQGKGEREGEEAQTCGLTGPSSSPMEPLCEPPHFIQKLKSREVPEGTKVQLDCRVRGLPVPKVRWFCEGKELENSPDIQIITNGELHSLIIAEAFEEDTGRYSCFASNYYGTDSTSAEIYVEGASSSESEAEQRFERVAPQQRKTPKSAPSLPPPSSQTLSAEEKEKSVQPEQTKPTEEPEPAEDLSSAPTNHTSAETETPESDQSVQTPDHIQIPESSESSTVQCAQDQTPAPLVQVFLPLQPADTEPTQAQEESPPIPLQTPPLIPVVSSVLSVQAPTQTPLTEIQSPSVPFLQGLNGQPIMAAPVFTKNLQDLLASEGQLVVLECRVKGTPSPRVDWYREGKPIEDSPDFRILQKKEICTLVIAEVFPEDSGMFTCTASNKYGTVSSTAALRVKGNGSSSHHVRPFSSLTVEPAQTHPPPLDLTPPTFKTQPEVTVTNSIKPHSSTIRLDPLVSSTLRLDPLNTSTLRLDPQSSSVLRPDPLRTSLPSLEPTSLSSSLYLSSRSTSTPALDPLHFHRDPPGSAEPQSILKPSSVVETGPEQEKPQPASPDMKTPKAKGTPNGTPFVIPLPDPPPNSCLKSGNGTNHKQSRSGSRVGLRVHFKLPEDEEQSDPSSQSDEDGMQASISKEPPPVFAKPKLDPAQLQLLHNQVLLEQQQDTDPPTRTQTQPPPPTLPQAHPPIQVQIQPEVQSSHEPSPVWSPRIHREPPQIYTVTTAAAPPPATAPPAPILTPTPAPILTSTPTPILTSSPAPILTSIPAPILTSSPAPILTSIPAPILTSTPAPIQTSPPAPTPTFSPPPIHSPPSAPHLKMSSVVTSPPPAPQLNTAPPGLSTASVIQMNTIHASHLNLSPAAFNRSAPTPQFYSPPPPPKLSSTDPTPLHQITSPAPLLRSTHASLMNLTATSLTFNYTRPKEFIAAQAFSPVRSPSPTESPVPLLHELAAELNSSATSSPTLPPFSPPPRIFPTRVLQSPTSPPSLVSSPTPGSASLLNSVFAFRAQSPPQASSPTSSSSTPSPIQNPVAFLSSVLPSLTLCHPTNSMGLPKGAPAGVLKKTPKVHLPSNEEIRESKESLLIDIEKKLRFKDDSPQYVHQQKLSYEGKTASRPLGPNIPATVINYDEEYKVSSFEQRLMSEIEFRLERTPVEESDDEVQHDDIPTGKCIAPIFDKKLKNFRAMEGVPVTFSCKVVGIPIPKVYWFKDGKQILRKNIHYKRIREGDGTCALHIESVTNDDDGNYTIMAANPQGRISCSGHLIVQTGPPRNRMTPIHPQRVRARIQEVENEQTQERFFRPHFLQAPGDMMAHEGKLCRLDCKVSGLPSPELMWLVNGRPIYPDIYHKMLVRENGIHSLVIDPLTQNDAGTYTCIASNKAGQSSFSLELKVVEKEMKHPPQFVEKLQNMGIPEGTPVRMECRVLGMPPPLIFWKKDNDTIPRTKDRISMHQDATGYVCLLIQPTTKDDAGWYTVSAKNEAGIVSCTCRLDIYAQWHQNIPAPMKKTPRTGSRYAALTGQGLDIKSAFPTSENSPILFASSPPEATLESEEL